MSAQFTHADESPCEASNPDECEKQGGKGYEDHWCVDCGMRATKCPVAVGEEHNYGDAW